ncbi:MAG: flagellar basal body-associated FliL family protein [Opitutaceae bacterium]|jgi:flagellar protein FliL
MSDPAPDKSAEKPAPAAGKSGGGMLPTIIAVVLAPALSWAVVNFMLIPKLTTDIKSQLTAAMAQASKHDGSEAGAEHEADAKAEDGGHAAKPEAGGHGGKEKVEVRPKFENLTVNISGTQGTRYLKVTFNVVGKNDAANKKIDAKYAELVDTTLTILASLTMPELDEPSSKTVVRGRLVAAFNDLLKAPLVDQVFFSDFVVQ